VLEPLLGYLLLGYRMWREPEKYSGAWNFGPDSGPPVSVKELAAMIVKAWGGGKITESAKSGDPPETRLLALDCAKAKSQLGWRPVLKLEQAVELTVEWYKKYKIEDCCDLDQKQIKYYIGEFVKVIGL
jgi:CDP-glucose 4,6-dehydratase